MKTFKKTEYNDLREEIALGKLPKFIGRTDEINRLTRIANRSINNNVILVGLSGTGKTSLVYGWIEKMIKQDIYKHLSFVQLDNEHLFRFDSGSEEGIYFKNVMNELPSCVLFIDNFGRSIYGNPSLLHNIARLYSDVLKNPEVKVILTMEPKEYNFIEREYPSFIKVFETVRFKKQSNLEQIQILESKLAQLNKDHKIIVSSIVMQDIITYVEKFPSLGQLPQAAISIMDEGIVLAKSINKKNLTDEMISDIISSKIGIPKMQLSGNEIEILKNLNQTLNSKIINQTKPVNKIIQTLQRAKLGVRNPNKPLGSFLILGPSGVGKTETAKLISEIMFGRQESFIRFDMSEFSQDHTVQRLIGAPAGYSGYEAGGALTNALQKEPHCLILLDEIEKAHPKIFDIFLQVLDDGRLTSGQNETVDACNSIIMATSNIGVNVILEAFNKGKDIMDIKFIQEKIIPELAKIFRLEFINRFDSILVFNPLTLPNLIDIAKLEIKKVEKRLTKHNVYFDINIKELEENIKPLLDERFGARPVKRFIEETCESLLVNTLLNK
ncbi:MAG: ATPase with chaperone activity, ATP-binding subunit [Candidatus Nomurabacteria bacterium GW2011_GWE1_32_28]|uniref:ATPase with chaperone activity, ATP-binding subunit n=1 Tax=Candidatus Nomurabacteria bacterium GW2011_GWF1_31_48 TaxID=1618767 RepID=A0A0F9YFL0_9BACT|nr:MAG: ATPase with chaperone activity, ATP-binding subunit [Candidatus Nomurabacteria bacterium GW2011_GWF2_30_133]KKP29076.1 MAG: ATPase with chaperone activity, ATP-binding subunit [Candidatus Nomurabacteria bacterium GW2011_GWE2_31_40]KKP30514.1 MAG: ATPase with chaperone activity, ATP-binding subunit [Candidatus Nomurabacteria bacterium GW2011_GWF1_31_48]KKP34999.1 MAG: ATPase with chaperone activity, ATP-binding subunit [Candidatus Nomurabacteria bacterium GW2011_GWE1_32_28]HAS80633.1 hyp